MDISLVIPCYNSSGTIRSVLEEFKSAMKRRPALQLSLIHICAGQAYQQTERSNQTQGRASRAEPVGRRNVQGEEKTDGRAYSSGGQQEDAAGSLFPLPGEEMKPGCGGQGQQHKGEE